MNDVSNKPHSQPLSHLLEALVDVLLQVQDGVSGREAVESVPLVLRPAVQSLAFAVWRNWARGRFLLRRLANKAPKPHVRTLLEAVLALLTQDGGSPYAAFTLVNQAVLLSKQHVRMKGADGFVNACLRNYLRQADALEPEWRVDDEARWGFPRWWLARVRKDHPDSWEQILHSSNQQAPMTIRVNALQNSAQVYAEKLDFSSNPVAHNGLELSKAVGVHALPGFDEGAVSVQDAAAQLGAWLVSDAMRAKGHQENKERQRIRVLDACAAPGGKTGHLLELGADTVVALEKDGQRARRIEENLKRLGLQAQVVVADACQLDSWWDGQPFDAILLDAPCSASGIVRRHPDIRWLRRDTDIAALAKLQRQILQALWKTLKPSGCMLYATCSLFKEEGDETIQWFMQDRADVVRLPAPGHMLPQQIGANSSWAGMDLGAHDGFFYALMEKNAH